MSKGIGYEKKGRIAIFTINRPESRNVMNSQCVQELHDRMLEFNKDEEAWIGIITGAGEKAFCAGADIKEMLSFVEVNPGRYWERPSTPCVALRFGSHSSHPSTA